MLLLIRGVKVDHSTIQRWVFKFSQEIEKNMQSIKRNVCVSWHMNEA
jgi:putative transposase